MKMITVYTVPRYKALFQDFDKMELAWAVAFPQTDEQGQQLRIPVTLKAGSNQIDFGRFAGDWGYMFIKSIEVVAE